MIKKIAYGVLALLILSAGAMFISYSSFSEKRLAEIESGGQIAETAAGPIEYQLIGDGDTVTLSLHGTPGGYDQAMPIEDSRVLAPSRPGYLRTPIETGRTPAEQADAYAALMDTLDIDRAIVIGASGGGPSAIAFAERHPKRTIALIALEAVSQNFAVDNRDEETPFFLQSDFYMWAFFSAINNLMGAEGMVKAIVPNPENQRLLLEDPVKRSKMESLMWDMWPISQRQVGQDNDFLQFGNLDLNASAITVPTLIIHGTEDINVEYAQSVALAEQIPGAILHTIEGADNTMPFSHSEEMAAAIEGFLAGVAAEQ
jgi:pimeloyl-ACP methyl ester carboxylesterase